MHPTNLSRGAWGAARFRGQCVSATSAGGLGGQCFKLAILVSRTGNLHRIAVASAAAELLEILAIREGIQRPCGSEQSKYLQRCQGVQVSDGLVHQVQVQLSRTANFHRRTRASRTDERFELGAVAERIKRPWKWSCGQTLRYSSRKIISSL